jgi:GNAT superfamily N-acetyltransferase
MPIQILSPSRSEEAAAVLAEAFYDYPVMRFVLGPDGDYGRRLQTLIGFFVAARVLREELVLGVTEADHRLAAVALVSLPGPRPVPDELVRRREVVWHELGGAERARYEAFGQASQRFELESPHHHLNMIGVRPAHAGTGLARVLLDQVHQLADHDPGSSGVTLSTEDPRNLPLYERFGYQHRGYARVAPELETWSFFRPARA